MENVPNQTPLLSVGQLIASINQTFEYAYGIVEVEGEVASFKVNQNKWVFFDIKDEEGSVNCFMSVYQLRLPIEDGMKVVVRAVPKLTAWGKFSLTIQSIRPSGEGSIKKSYELLKVKLEKEGLFSDDRKRTLPRVPSYIAVISSTQAAGYADFIKILSDRWGGMRVDVAHVQVQGDTAPDQMIRAIKYFNGLEELPEVLVIIRGGGSADDLSAFNDELLVREIAASRIPTLVGVGHEVDESLADLVADVRAATPSNAAQIIVPDKRELQVQVTHGIQRIISQMEYVIETEARRVDQLLEDAVERMGLQVDQLNAHTELLRRTLQAYNPLAVLGRGYALVRGAVRPGEMIEIERIKDVITAEVRDVKKR